VNIPVLDKYTGEAIGSVPGSSAADVPAATRRAKDAFAAWSGTPAHRRAAVLLATARAIEADKDSLAKTIARESGKALKFAAAEVARGIETFTFSAEEAKRIHGETIPLDASNAGENRMGFYLRTPVGVVAAITPFNFPLNLVAHKLGPALAAGNTVVLKPAERTPLTAVRLAELLADSGLPDGVLTLLHGAGAEVGEALVRDKVPARVSFTGSPVVGERILGIAGLKKVSLELGNNSGTIIEADADITKAIPRCVTSAFGQSGQSCISVQRLYVHEAVAAQFLEGLVAHTKKLVVGNPAEASTDVGPMISKEAAKRAHDWIGEAEKAGATVALGGKLEGAVLHPTILTHTTAAMKVVCDEVFAPIVSVMTYSDFDEALRLMGDTAYGLQAGIYTRDIDKAWKAIRQLDMGGVMVNETSTWRADHMPYGGNGISGIGREGVRFAVEEMTNLRMVMFNLG
jgi:acyl-CoA reductase-like NAD-dependent aldehyde dehydrogenase